MYVAFFVSVSQSFMIPSRYGKVSSSLSSTVTSGVASLLSSPHFQLPLYISVGTTGLNMS